MVLMIPLSVILASCTFMQTGLKLRESLIRAFLAVFGIAAVATELLSAVRGIRFIPLAMVWTGTVLAFGTLWVLAARRHPGELRAEVRSFRDGFKEGSSWVDRLAVLSILLVLGLTLVIALSAPPNNYDSMTYHMARVVHWIQNQSVRFYATAIPRQNYSMPLAEYMILHLQILSRSDAWANLVQWSANLILILLAGEIAQVLRASRRGQRFAGLFAATLPMAILQSTSTQNDILTGVFCLGFGLYLLRLIESQTWSNVFWSALAFGLALLTKGTAYIYCAAIGVPLGIAGLSKALLKDRIRLVQGLFLVILGGLLLNLPFFIRNLDLYGSPLSTETDRITVDALSARGLYANLVRNISLELAVPFPRINAAITSGIRNHLGSLAADPATTFSGAEYEVNFLINEDQAGNLLHLLLLAPTLVVLLGAVKGKDPGRLAWISAGILSLLLFSLLIKWQPWGTRLQLPLFALSAPVFGLLVDWLKGKRIILLLVAAGLAVYSLPYLFLNATRPLVPLFEKSSPLRSNRVKRFFSDRPELYREYAEIIAPFYKDLSVLHTDRDLQYFASNLGYYEDYAQVSDRLQELEGGAVGLLLGENDWEYPLWVLTGRHFQQTGQGFFHLAVENRSRDLGPEPDGVPDFMVASANAGPDRPAGQSYQVVIDTPFLDLLENSAAQP